MIKKKSKNTIRTNVHYVNISGLYRTYYHGGLG